MKGKCIHSNVSVHVPSELIIINWKFMHEVNILPPPRLDISFLGATNL